MLSKASFLKVLRREIEPHIYKRGVDYYNRGLVKSIEAEASGSHIIRIFGDVQGGDSYEVSLEFDTDKEIFLDVSCSCYYEYDCKHAAALGIAYSDIVDEERNVPMKEKSGEVPLESIDADHLKKALRGLGISVDALPQETLQVLLAHASKTDAPKEISLALSIPPKKLFNPKNYYIQLGHYDYEPPLRKKGDYFGSDRSSFAKSILDSYDISPAVRDALSYIKYKKFAEADSSLPDFARFLSVLKDTQIPVYTGWCDGQNSLQVNMNPAPIKADLLYKPRSIYFHDDGDPKNIRHEFVLRMPDEYWSEHGNRWSKKRFLMRKSLSQSKDVLSTRMGAPSMCIFCRPSLRLSLGVW